MSVVRMRRLFFALILLGFCFSGRGTARGGEVEATRLPEFAGGVRDGAKLADPSIIYRISEACPTTACVIQHLKHAGAGPQALAFARYTTDVFEARGAIASIHRHRVADAVYADIDAGDIAGAWFLIGRSGDVVPLWTPVTLELKPRFAALLKSYPGATLWMPEDPHARFRVQDLPRGGQRFIFDFGVKRCHVCKVDSVVAIGFDFDAAGAFTGIEPMGFETTRQAN